MLDHVGLPVSDFERSKAFYTAVFAPLGYGLVMVLDPDGHNIEAVCHAPE